MVLRRRTARRYLLLGAAAALLLAFLAGMAAERLRFDAERRVRLERLDAAHRAYQQRLMEVDRERGGRDPR